MPVYEYEHVEEGCKAGKVFEQMQSFDEAHLTECPTCGAAVKRLISRTFISTPKTDSELKSMGFAKLVRRDQGVYENVTALDNESRVYEADKPETMPDLKKRIADWLHYDYTRKVELDEYGTLYYSLIDDSTSLGNIVNAMAKKLGKKRKDLEHSVILFTKKLMVMNMLVLEVLGSAQTRSPR